MSNANDCPVQIAGRAVETAQSVETAEYMEKVRAEIVRLEGELVERPSDVALLTALMRAYRTVGNEERLWEVMRTLREVRMGRCADMKRELEAFRELATVERHLAKWPRAIPLLERVLWLCGATHQTDKCDEFLKRLAEVDPTNPRVFSKPIW